MSESVTLPALGESVTEGTVTRWLKKVGDRVEVDEPLLEVSTDKVDTEIPSPFAGVIEAILVAEDETVEVGTALVTIGDGSGGDESATPAPAQETPEQEAGADETPAPEAPAPESSDSPAPDADAREQEAPEQEASAPEAQDEAGTDETPAPEWSYPPAPDAQAPAEDSPADDGPQEEGAAEEEASAEDGPAGEPAAEEGTADESAADDADADEADATDASAPDDASATETSAEEAPAEDAPQAESPEEEAPQAEASPADEPSTEAPAPESTSETDTDAEAEAEAEAEAPEAEAPEAEAPESAAPEATAAEPAAPEPAAPEGTAPEQVQPETPEQHQPAGGGLATAHAGYVTPIVRKLAHEKGVDLDDLTGTGVGGRIRKQDVLAAVAEAAPTASPDAPAAAAPALETSPLRGTTVPMSRLRKVVAERAVISMQTLAQLTTVVEVDVTKVAHLRDEIKDAFRSQTGVKLSFLPFFVLAAAEALRAYPIVNATVDGESIVYPDHEHISIAVDTERGLLTPVIRDAGELDLAGIAKEIADLADRTRSNKLKPDELGGGTFTVTNTGSRGALFDTPIVFLPQSAILGTGIVTKKPVVVSDDGLDAIAIRSTVYLALSYDHRIVDGADAARFLGAIKARLESGDFANDLGV